jgi:hypothetical protein
VTDHFVCQGERPVQLLHRLRFRSGLEDYVVAVGLVLDLVGETALAPEVDVAALRAIRLDELEPPLDGSPDRLLFQVRVDDDHDFVRTRHASYLLRAARSSPCGPRYPPEDRRREGRISVV